MSPAARRATGLVVVALVVAVACTFLGRWQWNRHVWRDHAIAVVQANERAAPVPLDQILPTTDTPLPTDDVWRQVEVVGHYEPDATVLLRNRPVDGNAAYHVLVPFVVEDASAGTAAEPTQAGSVLVVDRGWVPTGETSAAVVDPARAARRDRHGDGEAARGRAGRRTARPRPGRSRRSPSTRCWTPAGMPARRRSRRTAASRRSRRRRGRARARCPRRAPTPARTCPTRSSGGCSPSAAWSRSAAMARRELLEERYESADVDAEPPRPQPCRRATVRCCGRRATTRGPFAGVPRPSARRATRTCRTVAAAATRTPRTR